MLSRYKGERYKAAASQELVAFVEGDELHSLDYEGALRFYVDVIGNHASDEDVAYLGCVDRFFLFTHILGRHDGYHEWLYDRCREVELDPDYHLDLWSREHFKSSLITFAGSVQEILNDPDITIGVFSHTKGVSIKFVDQVRTEFERPSLRRYYPDICWLKPRSEAKAWASSQFVIRRSSNPKEATMEAHGLVDGQPTSRHFKLRIYDDVVTLESVSTPEQVKKTTEAWELSDNLGSGEGRYWMIGTRYSFGDSYGDIMGRGIVTPRVYAATHNGKLDGKPVFLSPETWEKKKRTQRSTVAAQMLQNPLSGKERVFEPKWLARWEIRPAFVSCHIMCDPSRGRTAKSDRTAMAVVLMDSAGNKYLADGFCHRMTLSQRWDALKHLHKKWSNVPGVSIVKVGYERFGQQSDDEYFLERMREERYHFAITELAWPREGDASKKHRVERLQPDVEYGALRLPALVHVAGQGTCQWVADTEEGSIVYTPLKGEAGYKPKPGENAQAVEPAYIRRLRERGQEYLAAKPLKRVNENGEVYDLTVELINEMLFFPFATHDDLVDVVSRIYDMDATPPSRVEVEEEEHEAVPADL